MPTTLLLDKEEMTRILERLACEVLERHAAPTWPAAWAP